MSRVRASMVLLSAPCSATTPLSADGLSDINLKELGANPSCWLTALRAGRLASGASSIDWGYFKRAMSRPFLKYQGALCLVTGRVELPRLHCHGGPRLGTSGPSAGLDARGAQRDGESGVSRCRPHGQRPAVSIHDDAPCD